MVQAAKSGAQLEAVIRDIQVGFSSFYAHVLDPDGVSLAQFAVLMVLARGRPEKMSGVAKALHVSLPAVTHLVDRLEQKHFVRRMAHPTDRRVTLLDVTDRGLGLIARTQGRTIRILTGQFMKQSSTGRSAILEFMQGLRSGIRKATDEVEHAR